MITTLNYHFKIFHNVAGSLVPFPVLSIAKLPHPELPSPQFPEYFYGTFPISVYQWGR